MARGTKSSYSGKQKRMAHKIEGSVRSRGGSEEDAERIGWATVNKRTGGSRKRSASKKSGSSRTKRTSGRGGASRTKSAAGRKGGRASARSKRSKSGSRRTGRRATRRSSKS